MQQSNQLLNKTSKTKDEWLKEGKSFTALSQYSTAIDCYDNALKIDPNFIPALNSKAYVYSALGYHQKATDCYNQILAIDSKYMPALNGKGRALNALGLYQGAINCYSQVLEIQPKNTYALNGKGYAFNAIGDQEQAIIFYDQAIKIDPQYTFALNGRGYALSIQGHYQDAIICYDSLLNVTKNNTYALNGKGIALFCQKQFQAAAECFEKALNEDNSFIYSLQNKALYLLSQQKKEEANVLLAQVAEQEQIITIKNNISLRAELWFWRGKMLLAIDEISEAEKVLNQALIINKAFVPTAKILDNIDKIPTKLEAAGVDADIRPPSPVCEMQEQNNHGINKSLLSDSQDLALKLPLGVKLVDLDAHDGIQWGQLIAQGGYGEIYSGTWHKNSVVIKKIPKSVDIARTKSIEREINVLHTNMHSHLIQLKEVLHDDDYYYLIMPRADYSLADFLKKNKEVKKDRGWAKECLCIALEVAEGLKDLHNRGILHRDLKSGNILLVKDILRSHKSLIADFGLVQINKEPSDKLSDGSLQLNSQVVGSVEWLPPEIIKAEEAFYSCQYTEKTDVYSYGVLLWEIIACEEPYANSGDSDKIKSKIKAGERNPIPEHALAFPFFEKLIAECCNYEAKNRPTIKEVAAKIKAAINELETKNVTNEGSNASQPALAEEALVNQSSAQVEPQNLMNPLILGGSQNVRKGLFRGHKRDTEVKTLLRNVLPNDFEPQASLARGDCFFDSAAQSLSCIKKEHYTAKGLRLISRDYVIALDKKDRAENWIYQRFLANAKQLNKEANKVKEIADRDYQHYMGNIGYTQEEIDKGEGLNIQQAIWGEQDIDGCILREVLNIHLHVVEFHEVEGQLIVSHQLDSKSVEEESIDYAALDTVHIAVFNSHFVPLLPTSADMPSVSVDKSLKNKENNQFLHFKNEGIPEPQNRITPLINQGMFNLPVVDHQQAQRAVNNEEPKAIESQHPAVNLSNNF